MYGGDVQDPNQRGLEAIGSEGAHEVAMRQVTRTTAAWQRTRRAWVSVVFALCACGPKAPSVVTANEHRSDGTEPLDKKDQATPPPTVQTASLPSSQRPPVEEISAPDEAAAVREACARILPTADSKSPVVVLLRSSGSPLTVALEQRLRLALLADPRVTLAHASRTHGAPVADASTPGGHVNTVEFSVRPRPHVVVGTGIGKDGLFLWGSDPGPEGLGGSASELRWNIQLSVPLATP